MLQSVFHVYVQRSYHHLNNTCPTSRRKKKKNIGCDLLEEPCFIKKKKEVSLFTLANASDAVDKVPLPMHQFPTSLSAKLGKKKERKKNLTSGIQYTKSRGAVLWSQVHFSILSPIINQLMWALVQLKKKSINAQHSLTC